MFNFYPYTDFHEMNLDIILRLVKEMDETIKTFVSTNAIKYANPFQWNITTQYEKNTVVIEPVSGVAYLSVQPVPQGIAISNTDYWTPVFDLSALIIGLNNNLTYNNEYLNITSSTNYNIGEWVIWKNYLYRVTSSITAGDLLNVGVNIERVTVEEIVTAIETKLNNLMIVNVRDFGAVGDGVTDDSDAINTAISSAPDYSVVVFPAGTYLANVKVYRNNITLDGMGSKIVAKGVDNALEVGYVDFADNPLHQIRFDNVKVYNFIIDGAYDAGKTYSGDLIGHGCIITAVSHSYFEKLTIYNCAATGIDNVIESNYNFIEANVKDCGNALIFGGHYPNADVNSSQYGVYNIFSKGGETGFRLLDNCRNNICNLSIDSPSMNGLILNTQPNVNDCSNNIVNATIQGGCASRAVGVGSSKTSNNTVTATIKNVNSDIAAAIASAYNNKLTLTVDNITKQLFSMSATAGNNVTIVAHNVGTSFDISDPHNDIEIIDSDHNIVNVTKTDSSATVRTNILYIDGSSDNNVVTIDSGIVAAITSSGSETNSVKYIYSGYNVLWTNPDPSQAMAGNTSVSLSAFYDNIKYVIIRFRRVNDNAADIGECIFRLDNNTRGFLSYTALRAPGDPLINCRLFTYYNGVFTFDDAYDTYDGISASKVNNIMCIPVDIRILK